MISFGTIRNTQLPCEGQGLPGELKEDDYKKSQVSCLLRFLYDTNTPTVRHSIANGLEPRRFATRLHLVRRTARCAR